jgi:hypothetical protein
MYYEMPPPPPPENVGREIWKVMRLQLSIFAGYQILLALICSSMIHGAFIVLDMFPLVIHWLVLLIFMIISFSAQKKGAGIGYLVSLLITLIIGFGSCFMIAGALGNQGYF